MRETCSVSEGYIYYIFAILTCFPILNYYIASIFSAFGIDNPFATYIYAIIYLSGLFSLTWHFTSKKLICIICLVILLLLSYILTPQAAPYYIGPVFSQSLIVRLLCVYVPIFLISSDKIFDYERGFDIIYKVSLFVEVLCCIGYLCQAFLFGNELQEYMSFAYTGLPAILIGIYYSFSKKHILGIVISSLAILTIIFGGCRGAILTLTVFCALSLLFNVNSSLKRFVIIILLVVICLNINAILSIAGGLFEHFGYNNRIMSLIESDDLTESEGRKLIYNKALSLIGVFGHGLYSDRALLEQIDDATYCHNWILEFLVDFGVFVGSLLVLLIIVKTINLFVMPNKNQTDKFMIYFSISMLCVKFMLSGSYLNSPELALVFGWYVYTTRSIKCC